MRLCPDSPQGFGLPMIWLETWANCKAILECFDVFNFVACLEHPWASQLCCWSKFLRLLALERPVWGSHRNYKLHPAKQHKNGKPLSFQEEKQSTNCACSWTFQNSCWMPTTWRCDAMCFFLSTRFHFWSQVGLNFRRCAHCPTPSMIGSSKTQHNKRTMGKQSGHCKQRNFYFMIFHP